MSCSITFVVKLSDYGSNNWDIRIIHLLSYIVSGTKNWWGRVYWGIFPGGGGGNEQFLANGGSLPPPYFSVRKTLHNSVTTIYDGNR